MNVVFRKERSKVLSNLYVAYDGDKPVGLVHKPKDDKHNKNFWQCFVGIGDDARFLGHARSRKDAQNHVHWAYNLKNATVVVTENRLQETLAKMGKNIWLFLILIYT